jgi:glycosyltransferase involved in cell wall biosynthesis
MSAPNVAVVIPCYNAERRVARAIRSALAQDCPNLTVVVVDDGSTDGSLDVIRSFGDRIRWETGPNRRACAARNRGMALADADVTLFLDADDYYTGSIVRELSAALIDGGLDLAVGLHQVTAGEGAPRTVRHYPAGTAGSALLAGWVRNRFVQTGALAWRTSFLRGIGGWNEEVRGSQDIELVVRALLLGAAARSFDIGAVVYDNHTDPSRMSMNLRRDTVANKAAFVARLAALPGVDPERRRELGILAYYVAREAYRNGHPEPAATALRLARRLGFRGHTGTMGHVALSLLLGLRAKESVAVRLARYRRRNGGLLVAPAR